MTSPIPHLLIESGAAPKTGLYSGGAVRYQLLTDNFHSDLFIAITGNDGGSGYFSREAVPFQKLMDCIASHPLDQPLPSKIFAPAYEGRSANNPGFCCAILRHLKLLAAYQDKPFKHLLTGDWGLWRDVKLLEPTQPLDSNTLPVPKHQAQPSTLPAERASGPVSDQAPDPSEASLSKRQKLRLKHKKVDDPMSEESTHADAA